VSRLAEDIRRAATAAGRARMGLLAIEGLRLHERALRAGMPPVATLIDAAWIERPAPRVARLIEELRAAGCRIEPGRREVVLELVGGRTTEPIAGLVPLPRPVDAAALIEAARAGGQLLVVAVDVEEPGNLGALLRTSLAAGATALVAAGCSQAFHPKAVRTSMGSVFKLPVAEVEDAAGLARRMRERGVRGVGALATGGRALPEFEVDARSVALFLGSEARGLPADVRVALDEQISIPMASGVDSFSLNAAAAILLYALHGARLARPAAAR